MDSTKCTNTCDRLFEPEGKLKAKGGGDDKYCSILMATASHLLHIFTIMDPWVLLQNHCQRIQVPGVHRPPTELLRIQLFKPLESETGADACMQCGVSSLGG